MNDLQKAIDKWDNDRIDLSPEYVEPIMEAARAWNNLTDEQRERLDWVE